MSIANNITTNGVTTIPPADQQNLTQYMANLAVNPTVSNSAELTPVLQNTNETFLQNSGQLASNNGATINQQAPLAVPQIQAAQSSTTQPFANINPQAGQVTASQVNANQAQGTAEQMQVSDLSTVQGQLKNLYAQMENNKIPEWAQASVATVNEVLGARGLRPNSSIGFSALQGAVQQQAINIAAADASTYFKADLVNFDARQTTNLSNLQFRQQALLTNTASENAAKQINAQSEVQTQQFMASLVANINEANANRIQAADKSNVDNNLAAQTFYSTQEYSRQQFNATQQYAIDQSNVLWRRTLNTANTAAVNAANQVNTQNRFNLGVTALNNIWQQFRDEAAWAFTASENQANRNYNLALAANNLQQVNEISNPQWYEQLGGFAASLIFGK
jgi:hypothetical protein